MLNLRKHINNSPKISAFAAGLICSIAHAPIFFTPGLIGFSILAYVIYTAGSCKEAIKRNIAFGYGYFGYGFCWIAIGISVYIEDFWWMIPIELIGMPLIFCILTSFAAVLAWKYRYDKHYILLYSLAWIFIEWLTTWIFTGLPWLLVGYSVAWSDVLSQIASLCGVIGISFIIFNLSATFYYIWRPNAVLIKQDIYYMICVIAVISIYGVIRLENNPTEFLDTRVRIIQPSIPQREKWDADIFWQNLNLHTKLSEMNTGVKSDIILWSEAAVTAPIQNKMVRKYLNDVAKKTGAILMTGTISEQGGKFYTSVDAIDPSGRLLFEYHKHHLVPFGEYVPWENFLPIKKLTAGMESYSAGDGEKIFTLPNGLKIRPLICYESIFAHESYTAEADFFVNFTNNAWYGDSNGPYQHFYISKFRAIESNIPMIVVANNGVSGVIDAVGRVISKTKINYIMALDATIPKKLFHLSVYRYTLSYFFATFLIFLSFATRSFYTKAQ